MVVFNTVAWHRLVAKTRQSRTALVTFVGACLAVPYFLAEAIQGATNNERREVALRKELQAHGTMDSQIYTREQHRRLQSFFDELKSPEKSEAAYRAALEGNTLVGSIWSVLTCLGAWSLAAERTRIGRALSAPLLATLGGLVASNLGLIPSHSPAVYGIVNGTLLPLAIPLLLFGADLRVILARTGRYLAAFVAGSVATAAGGAAAYAVAARWLRALGPDGPKVAAALTARHIGGSVNYVAVAGMLGVNPGMRAAAIAADDLMVTLYFLSIYALAAHVPPEGRAVEGGGGDSGDALAAACTLCFAGQAGAVALGRPGAAIPAITLVTVAAATVLPGLLRPLVPVADVLGGVLMQIFFAAVGAGGDLAAVRAQGPAVLLWSALSLTLHVAGVLAAEKLFSFKRKETALASNANVGGPTTAAAMAAAKGWHSAVVPSLLIGIFGYAIATFIGIAMHRLYTAM